MTNEIPTPSHLFMSPNDLGPDELAVPLFGMLHAISFQEHENPHHFNTGTLFWSLTRLFGCYERILSTLPLPYAERYFLADDIEYFIIRFRIVLNDIAYILRQLLPSNARGLKGPKGNTHPRNQEVSIIDISQYLKANTSTYPEFSEALARAQPWISRLKNDRDNVVHYKSKALVFDTQPVSFCLVNAAGTERSEPTAEGGSKLVLEPISAFVNDQLLSLHNFMHSDLVKAVYAHGVRSGFKLTMTSWDERIMCIGVRTFKTKNITVL